MYNTAMKTVGMYIIITTNYIITKILKQLNNKSVQPIKNTTSNQNKK